MSFNSTKEKSKIDHMQTNKYIKHILEGLDSLPFLFVKGAYIQDLTSYKYNQFDTTYNYPYLIIGYDVFSDKSKAFHADLSFNLPFAKIEMGCEDLIEIKNKQVIYYTYIFFNGLRSIISGFPPYSIFDIFINSWEKIEKTVHKYNKKFKIKGFNNLRNNYLLKEQPIMQKDSSGIAYFLSNGKLHRDVAPAFFNDRWEIWAQNGSIHRVDGPAVIFKPQNRNYQEYWINGQRLSKQDYIHYIKDYMPYYLPEIYAEFIRS